MTILLSLDGFRADFLDRGLTPTLNSFVRSGVSPKYMFPAFPSLTFPNHFTLVTGLHPESHGVVGNTFWDPATEKEVSKETGKGVPMADVPFPNSLRLKHSHLEIIERSPVLWLRSCV